MKNIPDLLSYDKEGKIIENIDFEYFCNRASFMGNCYIPSDKYIKRIEILQILVLLHIFIIVFFCGNAEFGVKKINGLHSFWRQRREGG